MTLPAYQPPPAHVAATAAGLGPLGVLLCFTLLVQRWIDGDTALVWLLGLTVWVVVELTRHQRATDRYNAAYVEQHLAWRSAASLQAVVDDEAAHAATRAFVADYLAADRRLLHDGQRP